MGKKASSEDFKKLYDALWEPGPKVKYQNPDGRIKYKRKLTKG